MTQPKPYFVEEGRGEPLILLHAFPLDGRMWDEQRRELAREVRVIVPDFRGFGQSASLPLPASLEEHADDVAALMDALGVERATVAGLSMGGYIALAFARRHAPRLARLVLADTRSLPDDSDGRRARDQNIALVEREGVLPLVEKLLPKLLSPGASRDVVERVRSLGHSQRPAGLAAALAAMRDRPDSTPLLAQLRVPSAVIVGDADALSPVAEARAMAAALPVGALDIIPGAGHLANMEAPGTFTAALRRTLASKAI